MTDDQPLTGEQRIWLVRRIASLRSKMKRVGPFRVYGIITIKGMKHQLKHNIWKPHKLRVQHDI